MNKEILINTFDELKIENPSYSLDELLYAVYERISKNNERFDEIKSLILEAKSIDVYEYYTKDINPELKSYIENTYFSEYEKNDKGHGLAHMYEVVRRIFALNDTYKLDLNKDLLFTIATLHDVGKYIDHETHEKIAASIFYKDETFKKWFSEEERITIKEAMEDHRSSKSDNPRTVYGKLISSADRNTSIRVVFIRSFHVAHERTPQMNIEEYLDFTYKRLSKRYSEENPENMFFEDNTYKIFLNEMRELLKNEQEFKNLYCEINHITDRLNSIVNDYPGIATYYQVLKRTK